MKSRARKLDPRTALRARVNPLERKRLQPEQRRAELFARQVYIASTGTTTSTKAIARAELEEALQRFDPAETSKLIFQGSADAEKLLDEMVGAGNAAEHPTPVPDGPANDRAARCEELIRGVGFMLPPEVRADRLDEWQDELWCAAEGGLPLLRRTLSLFLVSLPAEVWRSRVLRRSTRQEA